MQGVGGCGDAPASGIALHCLACGGGGSAVLLPCLRGHQVGCSLCHCGHGRVLPPYCSGLCLCSPGSRLRGTYRGVYTVFVHLAATLSGRPSCVESTDGPRGAARLRKKGMWGWRRGLTRGPLSSPHPPVSPPARCSLMGGVAYAACVRPSAGSLGVGPARVSRACRSAMPRDHQRPASARGWACGGHRAHRRAAMGGLWCMA